MVALDGYPSHQHPWCKDKGDCTLELDMELLHLFDITSSADASCEIPIEKALGGLIPLPDRQSVLNLDILDFFVNFAKQVER